MHTTFKKEFLTELVERNGRQLWVVRSTTRLNTKEMTDYIENVRWVAAEMGIVVPDPSEYEKH